jgi:putative sugar O-methyltransferase
MVSKNIKHQLNLITQDLDLQKKIYHPTPFWRSASKNFINFFKKKGLKNFRNYSLSKIYFVPTYNFFGEEKSNKFKKASKKFQYYLKELINGNFEAFSDYKVFISGDDKKKVPMLHKFSESKIGLPSEHFEFDSKYYSRSSLNYLMGLVFLKKNIEKFSPKTFLEIGGGFGTLGEILFSSKIKNLRYISIDIPPLSLVSEYYLSKNFGSKNIDSYFSNRKKNYIKINKLKKKITCLCSWQIEKLIGKIDVFVNFVSFQEMEPEVVKNYIKHVIRLSPKYILLRNLREGKQKKTYKKTGVIKQTKKNDYIKYLKTKYILKNSNVIPYGEKKYDNFHSELLLFKKL